MSEEKYKILHINLTERVGLEKAEEILQSLNYIVETDEGTQAIPFVEYQQEMISYLISKNKGYLKELNMWVTSVIILLTACLSLSSFIYYIL